jgi:hypothetical protein
MPFSIFRPHAPQCDTPLRLAGSRTGIRGVPKKLGPRNKARSACSKQPVCIEPSGEEQM